jgi:methionyl-tRNA formyltransferase
MVQGADAPSVVFFGYGELAAAGINTLIEAGARIVAVVLPGNRVGADVEIARNAAVSRGLPIFVQPGRRDIAPLVQQLRGLSPDVLVVWSYSMIIPTDVIGVARHGAVNVHGGLLPSYRGGHVLQWAMINGEAETGVTLHYMDEGIDTGPVVAQQRFAIDSEDDAVAVKAKLMSAGSRLLKQWWPQLANGTAPREMQDESTARYWPMRAPADGLIDWATSATRIVRMVRALASNDPGAYVMARGRTLSLRRAQMLESVDLQAPPGQVVFADRAGVRIATLDGDVLITEASIAGAQISPAECAELLRPKAHA